MKRENRKAWPKLVRDEWPFPVVPDDYGQEDLRLKLDDCTCSGTGTPQIDPPPTPGDSCLLDEYTHCGTNGLTEDEIAAGTHPVVYMRAWDTISNPTNIWVFEGLGGACYRKTGQVNCEDAQGRLLNLNDWKKLDYDVNNVAPCQQKLCNQYDDPGSGRKFDECTWEVTPFLLNVPKEGGSYSVTMKSAFGCSWESENRNDDSWFDYTPTTGLSGREITVTVDENDGDARTGYIDFTNRVAARTAPIGTDVGQIEISQDAGLVPVPGSCPGRPPLLDQYTVSGGPMNVLNDAPCYVNDLYSLNAWDGIVTGGTTCTWGPNGADSWVGKTFTYAQISLGVGYWELLIVCSPTGFPSPNVYRKTTGSTPVGIYTAVTACTDPATLTVS